MRKPLICGNWKMNGSRSANAALVAGIRAASTPQAELAVCPPTPYLGDVADLLAGSTVALGAQDAHAEAAGAFTGDVAVPMLAEFGVRYVIVGHSERRAMHAESDDDVAAKFIAVLDAGLAPILCVGETLDEREAGTTETVVSRQLNAALAAAGPTDLGAAVVAYEPVWAIGTGRTATPEMAQDVHAHIRALLAAHDENAANSVRVLYGGSMKPQNAAELLAMPDVDGGLIGGASLQADDFVAIAAAAPV
ncbi:MAG: triose-phosphate isomerase [Pseudomonadota bacterium]